MRQFMSVAVLSLLTAATTQANPTLITNGGFETGDFTGWTQGGNTGFTGVSSGIANTGTYAAFFGPVGSVGTLSQVFNSPTGLVDISFALENTFGGTNSYEVLLNGNSLDSLTDAPAFGYTNFSFQAPANIGANTLEFRFRNDPSFYFLDDVVVTATPEPMSMAVFGIATLTAGGFGLRRFRKA